MKQRLAFSPFLFAALFAMGCVAHLKDYKAQSADEEAIKVVLLHWENSWSNADVSGVLSVFSEDAQIMYGPPNQKNMASKNEYKDIVPERMAANPKADLGSPVIPKTRTLLSKPLS